MAGSKDDFQRIGQLFVRHRYCLIRSSRSVLQSAIVDDDGYFAELLAAVCTGVKGRGVHGVDDDKGGDLRDGTEVKKAYRLDPNVDVLLNNIKPSTDRKSFTAQLPGRHAILSSMGNKNACSLQKLTGANTLEPETLTKTKSNDAFAVSGAEIIVKLGRGERLHSAIQEGDTMVVRQERGHINFGDKTRQQLRHILKGKPVLVHTHHDIYGRATIAVFRLLMTDSQIESYLKKLYGIEPASKKKQAQPYLFSDNERKQVKSGVHSMRDMGAHLIALGAENEDKVFSVTHWDSDPNHPSSPLTAKKIQALLTSPKRPENPPPGYPFPDVDPITKPSSNDEIEGFFQSVFVDWIDGLKPFCEKWTVTRNIGLANRAQHLVGHSIGILGTMSGARGWDLNDNGQSSEIKLATGGAANSLIAVDTPRLTLGWGNDHKKKNYGKKHKSWRRLFAVRITLTKNECGDEELQVWVYAPSQKTMTDFRKQVDAYFKLYTSGKGGGLQYHASRVPSSTFGTADRKLKFVERVHLSSTSSSKFRPLPFFS